MNRQVCPFLFHREARPRVEVGYGCDRNGHSHIEADSAHASVIQIRASIDACGAMKEDPGLGESRGRSPDG